MGMDVRSVLPFYRTVSEGDFEIRPLLDELEVPLGTELLKAKVLETRTQDDVPFYLIDREDLYHRPNLYGNPRETITTTWSVSFFLPMLH